MLDLSLLNGFTPAIGQTFDVLTFGSHTGQFDVVNGAALGNGNVFLLDYQADRLRIETAAALHAAASSTNDRQASQSLNESDVQSIFTAAVSLWGAAGVDTGSFRQMDVRIADLNGRQLALATRDTIFIDRDAAGFGWFVDKTPADNSEFVAQENSGLSSGRGEAANPCGQKIETKRKFGGKLVLGGLGRKNVG